MRAIMLFKRVVTAVVLTFIINQAAIAEAPVVTDLPVKLGDSVDDVKHAFGTTLDPKLMESAIPSPSQTRKKQLRLKTKGVWVFFEKERVVTYRVDAPFKGNIGGVRIGDDVTKLTKLLGAPVKTGTFMGRATYTYYFDDVTTTNFVFSGSDELETIFFLK